MSHTGKIDIEARYCNIPLQCIDLTNDQYDMT